MLGTVFRKAQNKIQDPSKLRRLVVDLIDKETCTKLAHRPSCPLSTGPFLLCPGQTRF